MQGDKAIIRLLNAVLTNELTAVNQYYLHARMYENWGFARLGKITYEESIGEMKHAELLIDRILFLEGVPEIARYDVIRAGNDVKDQFEVDLDLETRGVKTYNEAVALFAEKQDSGSRELAERILVDSEEHVDWLETQLNIIEQIGIERYLAEQLGEDDDE